MSFADDSKQFNNQGFNGDMLAKPGTLPTRFPSWEKPTVFRPFPSPDGNGGFKPWRRSVQQNDFTDWIKLLPSVVRMAGTERKITFLSTPSDMEGMSESPMARIVRIVKQLAKTNPAWKAMLQGTPGQGAPIPFIDNLVAMQGLLLFHNGNDFRANPKNVMLVLPRTGSQELLKLLHGPGINPNSTNMEEIYLGGDVVHLDHGKFLTIKQSGETQATTAGINFGSPGAGPGPAFAQQDKKSNTFQSYAIEYQDSPPIPAQLVSQCWVPWENVVNHLTTQEQIEQLCTAFKPDFIAHMFRDSPFEQLVPKVIRDRYFVSGGVIGQAGQMSPAAAPGAPGSPIYAGAPGGMLQAPGQQLGMPQAPGQLVAPTAAPGLGSGLFSGVPMQPSSPLSAPVATMPMPSAAPPAPSVGFAAAASAAPPAGGMGMGGINFGGVTRDSTEQQGQQPQAGGAMLQPPAVQPPAVTGAAPGVASSLNRLQNVMQTGAQFSNMGNPPPATPGQPPQG